LLGESERVDDAEHGVDRIRIRALVNGAAARAGVPSGAEISAVDVPEVTLAEDVSVMIRGLGGWGEVNIEAIDGLGLRIDEAGVALLEEGAEFRVTGVQEDGDAADLDDNGLRGSCHRCEEFRDGCDCGHPMDPGERKRSGAKTPTEARKSRVRREWMRMNEVARKVQFRMDHWRNPDQNMLLRESRTDFP